jgi:hypothetical protein
MSRHTRVTVHRLRNKCKLFQSSYEFGYGSAYQLPCELDSSGYRTVLTTELFPPTLVKTHYWDRMQMEGKFLSTASVVAEYKVFCLMCANARRNTDHSVHCERQVMKSVLVSVNFPR